MLSVTAFAISLLHLKTLMLEMILILWREWGFPEDYYSAKLKKIKITKLIYCRLRFLLFQSISCNSFI